MCANCFTAGDFQCNGPAACWPAPTLRRRTDGTAASIPPLKKGPLATLGAPLHRRSQLPARLDAPRHLEPRRVPAGNPRNRRTQEREDLRRHRTLAYAVRLPSGHRLQCRHIPGLPRATRPAVPPPGSDSDSGQRSYHKDVEVWSWFKSNRHWLEVHQLPPYSPELNPTERLWQHTRKSGTHNRFFGGVDALLATLTRVFGEMQSHPELIRSYLTPFC